MSAGIHDYVAGAFGGAAGLIIGHPFDTTKVQMQTSQTTRPYKGTLDAVKNIGTQGMSHGFFRGLGFPLASYGLVNSVFFGVYSNTSEWLRGDGCASTLTQTAAAAATGGACQLVVACPVDVVKVVLQSQISRSPGTVSSQYFKGPRECIRYLYDTGGIRRCYRGLDIMCLRDIPASVLYFLIYENLKTAMMTRGLSDSRGIFADIMAGGLAGCLSWAAIIPMDVVKSEIQADFHGTKYRGVVDCAKKVYRARGLAAFTTGFVPCMIRAFPTNAAIFVVYTQSLSVMQQLQSYHKNSSPSSIT